MKRRLLSILLFCFAGAAHADWVRLDSPMKEPTLYKDSAALEKTGPDTFKAWHVVDYAGDQDYEGKPFRSMKLNYEYDCGRRMLREWLRVLHRDAMGNGLTVYWTHGPWPLTKPDAGSVDEALVNAMCGR